MREEIQKIIKEALLKIANDEHFSASGIDFVVEHPVDLKHGDYSTNVAMVLAKKINQNPRDLAGKITEVISELKQQKPPETGIDTIDLHTDIEKIEVAGPGFINFYLSKNFFNRSIKRIINGEANFGRNKNLHDKNIIIEYTDPNPFKQFHIGHLMSNTIGESIARILEWNGAKVTRVCYQGDVGLHVAKSIWAMKQNILPFPSDSATISEKTEYLGKIYTYGADKYEENEQTKNEVNEINKKVYELFDETKQNDDSEIRNFYEKGREWSLWHFNDIYEKLGTTFAQLIFEHDMAKSGSEIVRANIPEIFELSNGAVIYRGEKDGLHTRVFINSIGLPTYETKDIGLSYYKDAILSKKFGKFDASIVITADEQKEYYKVVLAALNKLNPAVAHKTLHITHGMMRFAEGKMSSRKGNIITGESLLSDIEDVVKEKISDRKIDESEIEKIKTIVAVGAIKYSILKQAIGRDIIFDRESSVSFEGDSGPYLQYTFARCKSIIDNAQQKNIDFHEPNLVENWEVTNLEKLLYRFPEIIKDSYSDLGAHNIVNFLTKVAGEFNSFYANNMILDGGESEAYKVSITKSVLHVIQNGLKVLGIKTPERM